MSAPSRATKARTPVWALPLPAGAGVGRLTRHAFEVGGDAPGAGGVAVTPLTHAPHQGAEVVHHLQGHLPGGRVPRPQSVTDAARERLEGRARLRHRLQVGHQRRPAQQAYLPHELLAGHAFGARQQRLEAVQAFPRLEGEEIGCAERVAHGAALSPEEVS